MSSPYKGNIHHLRTRLRFAESLVAKWLWRIAQKARLAPLLSFAPLLPPRTGWDLSVGEVAWLCWLLLC